MRALLLSRVSAAMMAPDGRKHGRKRCQISNFRCGVAMIYPPQSPTFIVSSWRLVLGEGRWQNQR
jgi:hypothetical protein